MSEKMKTIYQKREEFVNELHVPKDKYNSFGKYNFRSKESILTAVKPLCAKYGVNIYVSDAIKSYTINGVESSFIESTAFFVDSATLEAVDARAQAGIEKAGGMAMPQAFGSASSYAGKYALGNLLGIDDTADPDATNDHKKSVSKLPTPTKVQVDAMKKAVANGAVEDVKKAFKKYTISESVKNEILKA